jgi:3-methylfumaryl-CoA hydratase
MSVAAADVDRWRGWIGRSERRVETVAAEPLRRFAAVLGEDLDIERIMPSLGHWALFLPATPAGEIGEDGHPKRGGLLPLIDLPRRMFAAADVRFDGALAVGRPAERISTVRGVTHKVGGSGDLVFVEVEHHIRQDGIDRIVELQTIVYRGAGAPTPPVVPGAIPARPGDVHWQPGPVDLFRFSAVTFNGHRIHYDLPYVTAVEHYPALVVHGPFTACRLFGRSRAGGRQPTRFGFRALAPIFCGAPVVLREDEPGTCRAIRADGVDAMVARIEY